MRADAGDKTLFLFMAEMFHLDPDDKLEMVDHTFNQRARCITHTGTHRAFTVIRRSYGCEFDYIDGNGMYTEQIIDEPLSAAQRAIDFLNGKTDII